MSDEFQLELVYVNLPKSRHPFVTSGAIALMEFAKDARDLPDVDGVPMAKECTDHVHLFVNTGDEYNTMHWLDHLVDITERKTCSPCLYSAEVHDLHGEQAWGKEDWA